jgi:hypothetical protein
LWRLGTPAPTGKKGSVAPSSGSTALDNVGLGCIWSGCLRIGDKTAKGAVTEHRRPAMATETIEAREHRHRAENAAITDEIDIVVLSRRDRDALVDDVLSCDRSSGRLRAAIAEYRRQTGI